MALQRTKLANIQYVASTAGSIYTNTANKTVIKGLVLHNTNTSAETVKVYNVPPSAGAVGTAGVSNLFLNISLPANDTLFVEFPYAVVLTDVNGSIQAVTTTASKVTVMILGDQDS